MFVHDKPIQHWPRLVRAQVCVEETTLNKQNPFGLLDALYSTSGQYYKAFSGVIYATSGIFPHDFY